MDATSHGLGFHSEKGNSPCLRRRENKGKVSYKTEEKKRGSSLVRGGALILAKKGGEVKVSVGGRGASYLSERGEGSALIRIARNVGS